MSTRKKVDPGIPEHIAGQEVRKNPAVMADQEDLVLLVMVEVQEIFLRKKEETEIK